MAALFDTRFQADGTPSPRSKRPASTCARRTAGGGRLAGSILLLLLCWAPGSSVGAQTTNTEGPSADEKKACLIVSGLGGVPEYEENFSHWAQGIKALCQEQLQAEVTLINGAEAPRLLILQSFETLSAQSSSLQQLWLFLVGHGTFDGREYKFNIRGPDLTGSDLSVFLDSLVVPRVYLVAATSSSGILLKHLGGPRRVVLTATRNERERQPPLFASFFLEGALAAEADTNKDHRVSLAEVFTFCEARVSAWYKEKNRIQSEHPVLEAGDDAPAALAFLSEPPEQAYRSLEARQLAPERTRLEREVEDLKLHKMEMTIEDYYRDLEQLLVKLATLNERIRELEATP